MHELTQDLAVVTGGSMTWQGGTDVPPLEPPADPVLRPCRTNGPG